jgi:hypothetical protein
MARRHQSADLALLTCEPHPRDLVERVAKAIYETQPMSKKSDPRNRTFQSAKAYRAWLEDSSAARIPPTAEVVSSNLAGSASFSLLLHTLANQKDANACDRVTRRGHGLFASVLIVPIGPYQPSSGSTNLRSRSKAASGRAPQPEAGG